MKTKLYKGPFAYISAYGDHGGRVFYAYRSPHETWMWTEKLSEAFLFDNPDSEQAKACRKAMLRTPANQLRGFVQITGFKPRLST